MDPTESLSEDLDLEGQFRAVLVRLSERRVEPLHGREKLGPGLPASHVDPKVVVQAHSDKRLMAAGSRVKQRDLDIRHLHAQLVHVHPKGRPASAGVGESKCVLQDLRVRWPVSVRPNLGCHWVGSPGDLVGSCASVTGAMPSAI